MTQTESRRRPVGSILLVEDDPGVRHGVAAVLRASGYAVTEVGSCVAALCALSSSFGVVLTDLELPDGNALSLLPRLRAVDPNVPVYVMTGFATAEVAARAITLGAEEVLTKPVDVTTLLGCMATALTRDRRVSLTGPGRCESNSDAMRRLEAELERLRGSTENVLVLGEEGTGTSELARRIHELGGRRTDPFKELVVSELFDAATGGTLFLGEAGDLDLEAQAAISKFLEGEVDVRLIAATHRDLMAAVADGGFRADLFRRLSSVTVRMPPLRERAADIPLLVEQILEHSGCPEVLLSREAWHKLTSHPWPGNLRELENVLHRALVLRRGERIDECHVRFDAT